MVGKTLRQGYQSRLFGVKCIVKRKRRLVWSTNSRFTNAGYYVPNSLFYIRVKGVPSIFIGFNEETQTSNGLVEGKVLSELPPS